MLKLRALLPKPGKWDGHSISYTRFCGGCPFYAEVQQTGEKLCLWGLAWKVLDVTVPWTSCNKRNRQRPVGSWIDAHNTLEFYKGV